MMTPSPLPSVYIAACGTDDRSGIYRCIMEDHVLQVVDFLRHDHVSYLCFSERKDLLFGVMEGRNSGGLLSYHIQPDGSLSPCSEWLTPELSFCHLAEAPGGSFVYAADYRDGLLAQFSTHDGIISDCSIPVRNTGHGAHPERQEKPHLHYTIITPDKRFLCIVDLGLDCIDAYPLAPDGSILPSHAIRSRITPEGSGPRHFVFAPNGKTAYLLNELGNTVMVLDYQDGRFAIRQTLSSLPALTSLYSHAAAIRFSPDGRFLLASNRGYDTIATYRIKEDGSLALTSQDFIGGIGPRDFNFLPDGQSVLVGCEDSGNAFVFTFDDQIGRLIPSGQAFQNLPRPICIL